MIWQINFSLFFFAVLAFVNKRLIKNEVFGISVFWASLFAILVFLFQSLYILSELRVNYLNHSQIQLYDRTSFNIAIRYICFLFVALSLSSIYLWIHRDSSTDYYKIVFNLLFHLTVLWILSSEMLNIMDILKNVHSYRFGLSILSGVYALLLIILGISGNKRYLRISAIILFGVTLAKLFFYDITRLDIILKTILFMALGILMLIISFLYNKFAKHLFGDSINQS